MLFSQCIFYFYIIWHYVYLYDIIFIIWNNIIRTKESTRRIKEKSLCSNISCKSGQAATLHWQTCAAAQMWHYLLSSVGWSIDVLESRWWADLLVTERKITLIPSKSSAQINRPSTSINWGIKAFSSVCTEAPSPKFFFYSHILPQTSNMFNIVVLMSLTLVKVPPPQHKILW